MLSGFWSDPAHVVFSNTHDDGGQPTAVAQSRGGGASLIRWLVAGILFTAGLLKLIGVPASPFAQYGWVWQPWVQSALVVFEFLLAVWLILPHGRFLSWLIAMLTFVTFAVVSGFLGWVGQASCGCFGEIKTSPWWVFGLDVVVVILLIFAKPKWNRPTEKSAALWFGGSVLAAIAVLATVHLRYGTIENGISYLRGDELIVSNRVIDFGRGERNTYVTRELIFKNNSNREIRFLGGTNDCSFRLGELNFILRPGESHTQKVLFRLPKESTPGVHCRDAQLYTDSTTNKVVTLKLCCRVTE